MGYITTSNSKQLDLKNPTPEMICLTDIARGLSREGRYANQTKYMWTVADHSMLVARNVPQHLKGLALLHDATEAYMRDIPSPLKKMLPIYRFTEDRMWCAIANRFDLPIIMPLEIKEADRRAMATEKRDLLPNENSWSMLLGIEPYPELIYGCDSLLPFGKIEKQFLQQLTLAGVR